VQPKRKRSLGRDVFVGPAHKEASGTIKKILQGRRADAAVKEIDVRVKLTPSNLKQLDAIRADLEKRGKGRLSRNDLIRVAITLLSVEDF
jgi:hypothetical protein